MMDGMPHTVFKRSTLTQLYEGEHPSVTPGNLVSVTGNVLAEGEGDPFSATVNGVDVSYAEASQRLLWGGEDIVFKDGGNRMEDYTSEVTVMNPKLEFDVRAGTPEKGYMVQQGTIQIWCSRALSST